MVRWLRGAALCALLVTVQGCGKAAKDDPAADVQALLAAAYAGDAAGFEAHLDRPAARADVREQMIAVARSSGVDVGEGPSEFALDRMIGPDAFKMVRAGTEEPITAPPSKGQTALLLKPLDRRRVCVHDLGPAQTCLLTFAKEDKGWRLVAMPARGLRIEIPPEPAGKSSLP